MSAQTPAWVKDAVFYQIFPDRFARSPRMHHPRGLHFKPWGAPPAEQGYQGGDLYGIVDKLDYLRDLGINALYLNPVFMSASNHRYHTYDYLKVDPLLGGDAALRALVDEAHARDIRIVLDGVFNHASRGFWAFHHILENGGNSPYIDWFIVHDWPLRPYNHSEEEPHNYAAWWDMPALPKFNVQNPGVRDYLLGVAQYWIDFGVDGWRLDVPEEIDDVPFWQDFRRVVKAANPEAYIVGEIWHEATDWLQGDRFDAVMNYVFNRMAFGYFGAETLRTDYKPGGYELKKLDDAEFTAAVDEMLALHEWEITLSQLNLLDSHDTARTLWIVGDDESALRLATLFQMTMPGAPCVYYGDEVGLTGGNDPDCRAAFPWDEADWNAPLFDFHRRVIALRHAHPALRTGTYAALHAQDGLFAFHRHLAGEDVLVIFNTTLKAATVDLAVEGALLNGTTFNAAWGDGACQITAGQTGPLAIPPRDALVLVSRQNA